MRPDDLKEFTTLLDAVSTMLSRGKYSPSDASTSIAFRALQRFTMGEVRAAFQAHVEDPQRGRFAPTPADLIAQIEGMAAEDGRLGSEEAWARSLPAMDESKTVVWSTEAAEAFGAARPLLILGDEVGARMAFKEVYTRLVSEERAARHQVRWEASIGTDKQAARAALALAASEGRIACGENAADIMALPAPTANPLLLAAPEKIEGLSVERRALLANMRAKFIAGVAAKHMRDGADLQAKRRTEQLKNEAAQKVAAYAAEQGQSLKSAMRTEIQHSNERKEDTYDH